VLDVSDSSAMFSDTLISTADVVADGRTSKDVGAPVVAHKDAAASTAGPRPSPFNQLLFEDRVTRLDNAKDGQHTSQTVVIQAPML